MTVMTMERAKQARSAQPSDSPDCPLLLVFGLPRSGTTWFGKIFDSHPGTTYLHEPDSVRPGDPLGRVPLFLTKEYAESYGPRLKAFVDELPNASSARVRGKLPLFPKYHRSRIGDYLFRIAALGSKGIARIIGDAPLSEAAPTAKMVWKSIESTGRLPVLLEILPNARCIYVVRHPCGWMNSVRRGESSAAFPVGTMSNNVGIFAQLAHTLAAHRLGITLEHIMMEPAVARLSWWWLLVHEHVLEYARNNPRLMIVRYEEACERPAELFEGMFRFAGLEWHRQTADFLKASTTTERDGYYSVYRKPAHAAWKWHEEISAQERRIVESIVRNGRAGQLFGIH